MQRMGALKSSELGSNFIKGYWEQAQSQCQLHACLDLGLMGDIIRSNQLQVLPFPVRNLHSSCREGLLAWPGSFHWTLLLYLPPVWVLGQGSKASGFPSISGEDPVSSPQGPNYLDFFPCPKFPLAILGFFGHGTWPCSFDTNHCHWGLFWRQVILGLNEVRSNS